MTREEFIKMHAQAKGAGRLTQKVVRTKSDLSDGILRCETQAQFIRNGVIHVVETLDVALLACGHQAKPRLLCRQGFEEGIEPHYVCAECASKCSGCAANICAFHAAIIEDAAFCAECAGQLAWDGIAKSVASFFGRFLA